MQSIIEVLEHLPITTKIVRSVRGETLRDAAKSIGVSFATLSRLESGKPCNLDTAIRVLKWIE